MMRELYIQDFYIYNKQYWVLFDLLTSEIKEIAKFNKPVDCPVYQEIIKEIRLFVANKAKEALLESPKFML